MHTRSSFGCRLCGQPINSQALSLGGLPVCNRFTLDGHVEGRTNLDIVECASCQLIQLRDAPPPEALVPAVPWIRYREPEGHLDALVEQLVALRPHARRALGTGPFEQPLLTRLVGKGLDVAELDMDASGTPGRYPYLETWQARLNAAHLSAQAVQRGAFDIVSCRYLIEHTSEPLAALQALRPLLDAKGLLLIEVPDSSKFLAARDYCFLWEEHSCYFVDDTLRRLAEMSGYRVLAVLRYPGVLEDALVAVLEAADGPTSMAAQGPSGLFQPYRDGFAKTRARLREQFAALAGPDRNRIALFGIGHHAIMFANAFGIADTIALAVDDDPDKAGFFPPGFRVPVVGSERLLADEAITTCLFAVAPHIEGKVRDKLAPLAARGVTFHSIYAALDNAITKDPAS
ncbi:class I SAM-dependent methyltransferase [Bradyrhizobium ontarionense]|uniref:Class I SAM-dependent methyltransferase n=1 Tax=Bradyrhizobium ontarionense TaxID=2898149 RepID=A0ABY3RB29_9BRAD|nr:methyltransferase domain-containing protein [Bradyrhizobium sp. A19]UFZ04399.1 class I SAM-dependent methyltransferase [Bradyrhizobium sp. A19]